MQRLAVEREMIRVAITECETTEHARQGIAIEGIEDVEVRRMTRSLSGRNRSIIKDSGLKRRLKRKIAMRLFAPSSMIATDSARIACNGICRPLRPRLSGISPSASHNVLAMHVTSMLVARISNPTCGLCQPDHGAVL